MAPLQAELPLWDAVSAAPETPHPTHPPSPRDGELRRLVLGERVVHYTLRRGRRRSIGLTIDQRGLRVGAPARATLAEIETLIRKHADWVAKHLDTWRLKQVPPAVGIESGAVIPVQGLPRSLRIEPAGRDSFLWDTQGHLVLLSARPDHRVALLERALHQRAREVFSERLHLYAPKLGVIVPPMHLSNARTRWGSCSRRTGIRLHWRLIHAPLDLIDYVVCHELAHLREMNHTVRFWAEVEKIYPNWQAARKALRGFADTLPRFANPPVTDMAAAQNDSAIMPKKTSGGSSCT